MTLQRLKRIGQGAVGLAFVAAVVAWSGDAVAGGDPARGKTVALRLCGRCHVVAEENRLAGIESTPWFKTMARRPEVYPPERFRTFAERPPHPPQKIDITKREMEDLIAYVESLRKASK